MPPFVIVLNDDSTYFLQVEPTAQSLMQLAAKGFVFWAGKAIERRGVAHIALSGGSTPKALFELLASEAFARQVFWERVHVWWSDERDVPADDKDSNYKMAHDALLSRVPIPAANVHRVKTELGAADAAADYEAEMLRVIAGVDEVTPSSPHPLIPSSDSHHEPSAPIRPRFDLILLGMGDDGHTASLFPHSDALQVNDRLVVSHFVPKVNMQRITFTYPLINSADTVIFLVNGAGKAGVLRRVLIGDVQPAELPSQGVVPQGKLFWMVDADAAGEVATGPGYPADEFIYRRVL
jgi:6-phosphogluconolactonase